VFRPESSEDGRESWDSKLTFLLATIRYAVGLGNVWLFQYMDQKNVGGLNRCIIYWYPSFCENFRSVSRQLVWPVDNNKMCGPWLFVLYILLCFDLLFTSGNVFFG
jgi:hypothetical protein